MNWMHPIDLFEHFTQWILQQQFCLWIYFRCPCLYLCQFSDASYITCSHKIYSVPPCVSLVSFFILSSVKHLGWLFYSGNILISSEWLSFDFPELMDTVFGRFFFCFDESVVSLLWAHLQCWDFKSTGRWDCWMDVIR